ncbi:MAG TPA: aminopeptidase P N-terminal domain-containing protein [Polyangiaceae bacterium]|nr:aminopeptidase P N-terminal domain-containing protein [Polyangiaceae bacterium]
MSTYAERRKNLMAELPGGVAVFPSAPVAIRNNDVEHEYRQDSDFYYLTGFAEPDSVLVLATEHPDHTSVLFVRPRDPDREVWDGARAGVDGAVAQYGADAAFPISELALRLPDYLQNHERLLYRLGKDRAFDEKMLAALDATRARSRRAISWPTQIVDPASLVHEMRLFKSNEELSSMKRAAAITRDAHLAAMHLAKPGRYEYEVEAALCQVFRKNGSERPAYAPIVGSGPNATVLHYRQNDRRIEAGDLLLIDAGCEYGYYASDVTRTFPVDGKFSAPQESIYRVVLDAQLAAIDATCPGATLEQIHEKALHVIVDGLMKLALLGGDRQKIMDEQLYRPFFMHRTSHWLGMDVHDVGAYFRHKKPRPLEAGMVITVEPGIYIAAGNTSVPPEYRGIGVRIEDDVLVTNGGQLNLTADIPKSVSEIERACA